MIASPALPPITSGKSLFSRHYLETHLPRHPEWAEDPGPAFARLAALWARGQRLGATWNENQTETEFLRPALAALGWTFIPQAAATRGGRLRRPDYALFADAAARDEAYRLQGDDAAFYGRSLAIAEAKHWGRPLSRQSADGREQWDAGANPSHQMVNYLVGTRCPWGILTNGQIWRLYSREANSTASEFYEVDLATVFVEDASLPVGAGLAPAPVSAEERAGARPAPTDAFKRFWLFFRRAAFVPDAGGRNFVQRVAEGSASYAREVSDKLKELVFAEVMPEVAAGFIAFRQERLGITAETDASLAEIYRASLGLLYKLLFILYAEARGLLPADNPAYREESLTRMAADYADKLDRGLPLSDATHATRQYDGLLALFHRIDLGDPSLGIPRYDGGLFNPNTPENRFLETHKLSDRAVARAVDILVRDAGEPVDYGYISVRNLGSIYEGLLENRLAFTSPLPPLSSQERGLGGEVALVNDRGERKATGSYYTPDYIVDYIVRQTLGPVLDARQPLFEAAMARVADLRRTLAKTADPGAIRLLRDRLRDAETAAREAFLGIRCCDPAMGSGHFLVNAVDYLTDGIIQRMQAYQDSHPDVPPAWNPIQGLIERVRGEILDEMARQGIRLDPARLDDTSLLTRLVMKRCIYGVDLNRMAVELAKLSLWLHSFTVGAPLSFLDHHLRWGNSLIGADVRTVEAAIAATDTGQLGLFEGPFAGLLDLTAVMTEVAGRADATLADVRQSADEFAAMQAALTPYKQALDLWVSRHFGNAAAEELLTVHGADVLPALRGERPLAETYRAAVERAHALWEEKRFFHWDLEFPEVFVDLARRDWAENPGFDAVIGNPPYVRSIRLKDADPDAWSYYSRTYHAATRREFDIYLCFAEHGLRLLKMAGRFGMIMPNKWFTTRVGEALRSLLAEQRVVDLIVDFGHFQIFAGVTTYTCLLFLCNPPTQTSRFAVLVAADEGSQPLPDSAGKWQLGTDDLSITGDKPWNFSVGATKSLLEKLNRNQHLEDIAVVFKGTGTSADQVFQMQRQDDRFYSRALEQWIEIEGDLMRPSLTGRDIDPYSYETGNNLLFPYRLTDELAELIPPDEMKATYPKAWAYLNHPVNREILEGRDKGAFRDRKDWYGYGRPQNMNLLDMAKAVGPDVAGRAEFACDLEGRYIIDTIYAIRPKSNTQFSLLALTALLNSQMMTFFLQQTGTDLRGGYFRMKTTYLNPFPIPVITFTTPAADRARYAEEARQRYEQFCAASDPAPLLAFVHAHLSPSDQLPASSIRTDVVHDLLAFLAEQMIAMNQQKQAEVKGFLAWLAREIAAPIDGLTNKTRLQNYLGDYQKGEAHATVDELLTVLRQNRRKLAVDPSARAFQERLAAEHAASLAVLLPLKARLAATDRLIDRVVYRLYGLTEEEIAIVEGK